MSGVRRAATLVGVALLCAILCGPASAQYYQSNYGYGYNQGYYNQGYQSSGTGVLSGVKNWLTNTFGATNGDGQGLGRTLGGAAGIAAGSFGGAALASAVIKAAGLASMGPIAPILVGTAITAGGAFLGSKLLSHGGTWMDNTLGPDMTWTLVGAVAGSVAGFALLPALGPFAGPAGRILGAAVGGVAGGLLGKMFAPTIQRFATPKTIYAGVGALVGGAGFGIPGAIAGAVGGYALGSMFDKNFFSTQGTSLGTDLQANVVDYSQPYNGLRYGAQTVSNWVGNTVDNVGNRLATVSYPNNYGYGYSYPYAGTTTIGTNNPYVYASNGSTPYYGAYAPSTSAGADASSSLGELQKRFLDAQAKYQSLEAAGTPQRFQAYQEMMSAKSAYEKAKGQ